MNFGEGGFNGAGELGGFGGFGSLKIVDLAGALAGEGLVKNSVLLSRL